jgi:hypothetical protein
MAVTQNTYTGNGSTTNYSFTFPYLETTDIKVSVNGTLTTAYTLANATTVSFNSAPANGAAIRIYRETNDVNLNSTFYPGSAIRSQDLNDNFTQILYVSQETKTFAEGTDASAIQGQVNAAVATANTANTNANAAVATANTASSTANGIAATANSALSTAQAAETTANGISATANTALSTANSASTTANAALARSGGTMTGAITFVAGQTYPQVPQNSKTAAYTLLASDAGKHVSITTGGITIPSGVFSVGDAISIYNNSGSSQTITQGASTTLRLAGSASTGNRTIAQYGLCTILCVASNTFVISGAGLT